MAITGSIDGERRRLELLEMASGEGGVAIERAAAQFEVSAMTIRRDLETLEREGLIRRVRGGAVALPVPRSYSERLATRADAKHVIARKALGLLPARGAVGLDASTTVSALAAMIPTALDLTICTNSSQTFEVLARLPGADVHLTGGRLEAETGSLVGPIANSGAAAFRTEVFIASAAGLDPRLGSSEATLAEAEIKRVFAAHAARTVLCVDSSKLGRVSVGSALALSDMAVLVTELNPEDARLDAYRGKVDLL